MSFFLETFFFFKIPIQFIKQTKTKNKPNKPALFMNCFAMFETQVGNVAENNSVFRTNKLAPHMSPNNYSESCLLGALPLTDSDRECVRRRAESPCRASGPPRRAPQAEPRSGWVRRARADRWCDPECRPAGRCRGATRRAEVRSTRRRTQQHYELAVESIIEWVNRDLFKKSCGFRFFFFLKHHKNRI